MQGSGTTQSLGLEQVKVQGHGKVQQRYSHFSKLDSKLNCQRGVLIYEIMLSRTHAQEGGFAHESFSTNSSSLPAYNNSDYQQQGKVRAEENDQMRLLRQVMDLGSGLQVYVVGEPDGRPCVIWNYDIRGFNGGR